MLVQQSFEGCFSAERQAETMEQLVSANRHWGLSISDIPSWVPSFGNTGLDRNKLIMLAFYLPDDEKKGFVRTLDESWDLVVAPHSGSKVRHKNLVTDQRYLRLNKSIDYRPGIFWIELNLDVNVNKSLTACRDPKNGLAPNLATSEVIMSAFWRPDLVDPSIIDKDVPSPVMAGYELSFGGNGMYPDSPCFYVSKNHRRLILGTYFTQNNLRYSIPTVKKLFR